MKKTITLWATLLLVAFCSQAVLTLPRPVNLPSVALPERTPVEVGQRLKIGAPVQQAPSRNIEDDDADLYAYRLMATAGEMHGWYNFTAKYPENLNMVKSFGNKAGDYGICAATVANGRTYAYIFQHYGTNTTGWNDYQMPVGIAELDYATGEYVIKFKTETFHGFQYNVLFYDMAYDPVTNKIYACEFAYDIQGNEAVDTGMMNIYTIDPETCEPTFIGRADNIFTAMAADNGVVYGFTHDYDEEYEQQVTSILKFDPTTTENGIFKTEKVCNIFGGENIAYSIQTMEIDLTTHKLYWMGHRMLSETNYQPVVAEINLKNGKINNEANVPYNAQYLGLAIPYQLAADNAPARVTELVVTPAANGASQATITWTNPKQTFQLQNLTELTGVKIYRDGELIETVATTEAGAKMSFTDTDVPSAMHTYRLVPYNAAGDGLYREYTEFVGQDIPSFVGNLYAETNLDQATISWSAPTIGVNGGWINSSELRYTVYRGTYKIADKITDTKITDTSNEYKAYEYRVVPSTNAGDGTSSKIVVAFGPAVELPYVNQLDSDDRAAELKVIDNDHNGVTWEYTEGFQGFLYSTTNAGGQPGDDYLVLPHMELTAGTKYQIRFYYYTSNYGDEMYEKVQLLVGKGQNVEDLTTVVKDFAFLADYAHGAEWHEVYTEYLATEDGLQNFAFKCTTEEEMGFVVLSWFEIREVGKYEAEAYDILGPSEIYVGEEADFTVKVRNVGSEIIPSATVKLLNVDGKVVAQLPIENLAVDEYRDVVVPWTPDTEGSFDIYGVIRVDNGQDDYDWDDVTAKHIIVRVNDANADPWVVIGQDKPELYNDVAVFCLDRTYGRSQWFFYPDELGEKDLKITGIRLHYTASEDCDMLTEVPLVVRMCNTDRDALIDGGYAEYNESFEDQDNMTVVFDGVVDLSGSSDMTNVLEIRLDETFEYDSTKNLLVEFDKEWDEKYYNVLWHMDINPKYEGRISEYEDYWGDLIPYGRGGWFNYNEPYENDPWSTRTDYFPHIKFSYIKDNSVEGVEIVANINICVIDKTVCFSKVCDFAELYDIAGNKLASAKKVNTLAIDNIPAGVYVVKAIADGEIVTKKVMIK